MAAFEETMLGRKRATLAGGSQGTYLIVAIILTSGGRLTPRGQKAL